MSDLRYEFIKGDLVAMAARCVRGGRVTKRDAAAMMRRAYDEIRRLEAARNAIADPAAFPGREP